MAPKDFARFLTNYYPIRERPSFKEDSNLEGIDMLIESLDLTSVEIGIVTFLPHVRTICGMNQFAKCEADVIARASSGEIVLVDHSQPNFLMCKCAPSLELWFDAMAVACEGLQACADHEHLCAECSKLVGGAPYSEFFRLLLLP